MRPADIAAAVGVAQNVVSNWKAGRVAPNAEQLAKLEAIEPPPKAEPITTKAKAAPPPPTPEEIAEQERQRADRQRELAERDRLRREAAEQNARDALANFRKTMRGQDTRDLLDELIAQRGVIEAAETTAKIRGDPTMALLREIVPADAKAKSNGRPSGDGRLLVGHVDKLHGRQAFADVMGIPPATISEWITGRSAIPPESLETVRVLHRDATKISHPAASSGAIED